MVRVDYKGVTKRYEDGFEAVIDLDLDVKDTAPVLLHLINLLKKKLKLLLQLIVVHCPMKLLIMLMQKTFLR